MAGMSNNEMMAAPQDQEYCGGDDFLYFYM